MVALSEKWSAKGSIGVKDIQTDQAQIVVFTNQKKKKPKYKEISFLCLIPLLRRKNSEGIIITCNYIPGNM